MNKEGRDKGRVSEWGGQWSEAGDVYATMAESVT